MIRGSKALKLLVVIRKSYVIIRKEIIGNIKTKESNTWI